MIRIFTADETHYRRWVSVIPTLLQPGSAQFLAGRRLRGLVLFMTFWGYKALTVGFLLHPETPGSVLDGGWFELADVLVFFALMADSLRFPIRRMGFKTWACYLLVCVGIPAALALVFRFFFFTPYKVPTNAMWPTLKGVRKDAAGEEIPGDHVWVNRLAYRRQPPRRGDIVVFKTAGLPLVKKDTVFTKRVVGLPGETVGIDPPYVTIDGQRLTDPPVFRRISGKKGGFCGYELARPSQAGPFCLSSPSDRVKLGPSEYLVLGDNSTNSFDGRYYGPVQRSAIIGRVSGIYAPADRKKTLD